MISFTEQDGVWQARFGRAEYRGKESRCVQETILSWLADKKTARRIIIDCTIVTFLAHESLGGLRVLGMSCREDGGILILYNVSPQIHSVLDATGITRVLRIVQTKDDALALA